MIDGIGEVMKYFIWFIWDFIVYGSEMGCMFVNVLNVHQGEVCC